MKEPQLLVVDNASTFHSVDDEHDDQQLWLFHFQPGFDESQIKNVTLSVPKYPKHGQRVGSLRLGDNHYQIIEYDCSQNNMVNLFAVRHRLKVGKPFERHFHVLPELKRIEKSAARQRRVREEADAQRVNEMLFGDIDRDERGPEGERQKDTPSPSPSSSSSKTKDKVAPTLKALKRKKSGSESGKTSVSVKGSPLNKTREITMAESRGMNGRV